MVKVGSWGSNTRTWIFTNTELVSFSKAQTVPACPQKPEDPVTRQQVFFSLAALFEESQPSEADITSPSRALKRLGGRNAAFPPPSLSPSSSAPNIWLGNLQGVSESFLSPTANMRVKLISWALLSPYFLLPGAEGGCLWPGGGALHYCYPDHRVLLDRDIIEVVMFSLGSF